MRKLTQIALAILLVWIAGSCGKKSEFTYSGRVTNSLNLPVGNASVILYGENHKKIYEGTTNKNGEFMVSGVEEGTYIANVLTHRYLTYNEKVTITASKNANLKLSGPCIIKGRVLDSQTGEGKKDVKVSFTPDLKATSSEGAELVTVTDAEGYYRILDAPQGKHKGFIESEDASFFVRETDPIEFDKEVDYVNEFTLVSRPNPNELRVVLSWGEFPYDLDAHMTGPDGSGGRFHIYFADSYSANSDLDVDDTYSFGPETITIRTMLAGTYRYSVHNYSNQDYDGGEGIEDSPTMVEIYDSNGLIRRYYPPRFGSNDGNTWRVFELNSTGGFSYSITDINTYLYADYYDDLYSFRSNGNSKKPVTVKAKDF